MKFRRLNKTLTDVKDAKKVKALWVLSLPLYWKRYGIIFAKIER